MTHKLIVVGTGSCANCPVGDWNDQSRILYCNDLKRIIEPSKKGCNGYYFHDIPDDCKRPSISTLPFKSLTDQIRFEKLLVEASNKALENMLDQMKNNPSAMEALYS